MSESSGSQAGREALEALDRALAQEPKRDGEAFTAASEQLCRMRDVMIAERRAGGGDASRLERLNAVISSALAGHFPLGPTPWPEVKTARDELQALLG